MSRASAPSAVPGRGHRALHPAYSCQAAGHRAGIAPLDQYSSGSLAPRLPCAAAERGGRRNGSGLGLAICKAIVEAHGGRIAARDPEQAGGYGGARLVVTLPGVTAASISE